MTTQRLWINIYRAGHYHRQGKPGHANIHGGDLFTTEALAKEHAERAHGYVATVSVDMPVPEGCTVLVNAEGTEPTPLRETRDDPFMRLPWHTAPNPLPPVLTAGHLCAMPSLDTGDDGLGMSYEEWRAERERSGFIPAPIAVRKVAALLRSEHADVGSWGASWNT